MTYKPSYPFRLSAKGQFPAKRSIRFSVEQNKATRLAAAENFGGTGRMNDMLREAAVAMVGNR